MINHWQPWTVDGDHCILANEAEWRLPHEWNAAAERAGVRDTVIVGPDVFEPELEHVRRGVFEKIDACQHLDFVLTTSEPGLVRRMTPGYHGRSAQLRPTHRPNVILSAGPIRTQADADRLIPGLLKLRDLCGGLGVTTEPVEAVRLKNEWGIGWQCERCGGMGRQEAGCYSMRSKKYDALAGICDDCDGSGRLGKWLHLYLTGGIPEHCESLAGQCRAAGCDVIIPDRHD